ncbi:MAG: phytanoyl-CoA dioxygenase family protein [Bacteroidota bacterium]
MLNWLRTLKATYVANNILNRSKLAHNKALYEKYGIDRPLTWPIGSENFAHLPQELPWMDQLSSLEELENHPRFQQLHQPQQEQAKFWFENGYLIIKNCFSTEDIDRINSEIAFLLKEKNLRQKKDTRIFFAFRHSDYLKDVVWRKDLVELMSLLTGMDMFPFQSLNFIKGSQQRAHSDSIHMTTFPMGYLTATWLALEDVDKDNGPLFYYPGSHRLPYVMNSDFDHGGSQYRIGSTANARYEDKMAEVIEQVGLERKTFEAKAGDLLIWHANLIHGGDPILDPSRSRKSMVVHYFGKEVICYHELTQRPALLPSSEYH